MKVIEIGNCLPPNNEPGIIVAATEEELNQGINHNLLYHDVHVLDDFSLRFLIRLNEENAIERFLSALYYEEKKSLKMEEISKIYDEQLKVIKREYKFKDLRENEYP